MLVVLVALAVLVVLVVHVVLVVPILHVALVVPILHVALGTLVVQVVPAALVALRHPDRAVSCQRLVRTRPLIGRLSTIMYIYMCIYIYITKTDFLGDFGPG